VFTRMTSLPSLVARESRLPSSRYFPSSCCYSATYFCILRRTTLEHWDIALTKAGTLATSAETRPASRPLSLSRSSPSLSSSPRDSPSLLLPDVRSKLPVLVSVKVILLSSRCCRSSRMTRRYTLIRRPRKASTSRSLAHNVLLCLS
jgi:hypothetical protein